MITETNGPTEARSPAPTFGNVTPADRRVWQVLEMVAVGSSVSGWQI